MIAHHIETRWQPFKKSRLFIHNLHFRSLTVQRRFKASYSSSVHKPECLMPQADTQNGNISNFLQNF